MRRNTVCGSVRDMEDIETAARKTRSQPGQRIASFIHAGTTVLLPACDGIGHDRFTADGDAYEENNEWWVDVRSEDGPFPIALHKATLPI